jgi:hypothetical protein
MKTEVIKSLEAITEYLTDLDNSELISVHNQYCNECQYSDDEIYDNDEDFFNTYFEGKVLDAVRAVSYGQYNYSNKYVKFNGLGNLDSFNDPSNIVSIGEIAQAILDEEFTPYDIELIEEETEE